MPVIKGLKPSYLSYSGYEVLLIITAYMADMKASNKAAIYSILICTIIYLITIVTVVGNLSLPGIETRMWPTFDMVRSFEIEGFLFERYESLFIVLMLPILYLFAYLPKNLEETLA